MSRERGVNTGIEYQFRKLPDGTWQRRAAGERRWTTLTIVGGPGTRRVLGRPEWTWS